MRKFSWRTLWGDRRGQDMIEYACMSAFLVFAMVALLPDVITKVSNVMVGVYSNICSAGGSCPAPTNNNNNNNNQDNDNRH